MDPHIVVECSENVVAKVLAAEIVKDLLDRDAAHSPVQVHNDSDPAPTHIPAGLAQGSAERDNDQHGDSS